MSFLLFQILAYTPLVPNWAWHGSSYGFGDFSNNGWLSRNAERVLQHYRSGLNSIPTTEAYLADPTDLYLLRLAAGSISGVLANIDDDGAPAMAYHGDPALMAWDPASGDHGLAFYGHSHNTQSFLVKHPDFSWLCYFCNTRIANRTITLIPKDSYRRTVFIASIGLQIRSEVGSIAEVQVTLSAADHNDESAGNSGDGDVIGCIVVYDPVGDQPLSGYRLKLLTRSGTNQFAAKDLIKARGAYDVPVSTPHVTVVW